MDNTSLSQNNKTRRLLLLWVTIGILVIGLGFFLYWLLYSRFYETTDDAYVRGNSVLVMSEIPGHVNTIFADETDSVTKGQKLILLDPLNAKIALDIAKAQLAITVRNVSQLYNHVDQLKDKVGLTKDNLDNATKDLQRRRGLVVNKTISSEEMQHSENAFNTAKDSYELAKQELIAALAVVEGVDLYHHPQIEQAAVNVRNAYLNLQRTTIYAPVSGYVAKRPVQVGQQINANTVLMVIIPLNELWVDANYKESQLRDIRIGQNVTMTTDAYGSDVVYHGTVLGLSPGTGSAFDLLPPQNATGNWIKVVQRLPVRISLSPKELEKNPLSIGLSVTVTIASHNHSGSRLNANRPLKALYDAVDYSSNIQEADTIINEILEANSKNLSSPKEP